MDVQGLKNYVRAQLDLDDEELPDTLLDIYLQEAFDRTMAFDNRWPRNEATWTVAKVPGEAAALLPPDLNIPSLTAAWLVGSSPHQLLIVDQKTAEDSFGSTAYQTNSGVSNPAYISVWNGRLHL